MSRAAGSTHSPGGKSLQLLSKGHYDAPQVLATDLGLCSAIARAPSQNVYFACTGGLWEIPPNGSPEVIDPSLPWLRSISLSVTHLYFVNAAGTLGRRPLQSGTLPVEHLLDGLVDPVTVRTSESLNAVFFVELGTKAGLCFDGTLRVLTRVE